MSDLENVISVKDNGCGGCFSRLIALHSNLFYKICGKYTYALSKNAIPSSDVYDNKNFVFLDSILTFDQTRGTKFSTWLANKSRFFCLNLLYSRRKIVNFPNDEIKKIIEGSASTDNCKIKIKDEFDYAMFLLGSLKDKRIKNVFELRDLKGEKKANWKSIAEKMNVSVQTAINLHSRGALIVSRKMKNKEICHNA